MLQRSEEGNAAHLALAVRDDAQPGLLRRAMRRREKGEKRQEQER
jgi:hypothetical protein